MGSLALAPGSSIDGSSSMLARGASDFGLLSRDEDKPQETPFHAVSRIHASLQKELHDIVSGGTVGGSSSQQGQHKADGSLLSAVLHDPSMAAGGGAVLATY